jgi:hypothetical protein
VKEGRIMADDTDTFVLEYKVQSDRATKELAALQKNIEGVNKTLQNSTESVTRFVADLTGKLGTLSPAFSELSTVIRGIGSAAGAAGVAMVVLGEGIRAATFARDQFNNQRQVGIAAGMSGARVEDMTRQLRAAGSGNVKREDVSGFFVQLQQMARAAGIDPKGREAVSLSQLGLNSGMTTVEMAAALGGHWSGASRDLIMSEAGTRGLNKDVALALGQVGPGIAQPKMDFAEYEATAGKVKEVNVQLVEFDESMNKLGVTIGDVTLPAVNAMLKALNRPSPGLPQQEAEDSAAMMGGGAITPDALSGLPDVGKDLRELLFGVEENADATRQENRRRTEQQALVAAAEKRLADEKRTQDYKQADKEYEQAQLLQTQQELAISLFAQSVATFSNAVISQEQALAIWAGVAGAAAGLSNTGYVGTKPGQTGAQVSIAPGAASSGLFNRNNPGNIKVTPWSIAHGAQGNLKEIATFATPEAGSQAMSDLLQSDIYKGKGINTISGIITKWAPPSENNTAAYIKFVHDATGLDANTPLTAEQYGAVKDAMIRFEGAHSGPRAVASDKHFKTPYTVAGGAAPVSTAGASAEGARLASVQAIVAARAHVDLRQLQQGRVSRGDVEWAMTNQMSDYMLDEQRLTAQSRVPGLPDPIRQQLIRQQADTDVKISNLRDYWNVIRDNTRKGDRETTQNEYPVMINNTFNGYDSKQIWNEIDARLRSSYGYTANAGATNVRK